MIPDWEFEASVGNFNTEVLELLGSEFLPELFVFYTELVFHFVISGSQ